MNELAWLKRNRHYPEKIDEVKLKNIFYFTLVWNVFEKECCGNDARIKQHPRSLAESRQSRMEQTIVDSVFIYFKDRYFPNGVMDEKFQTFKFGRNENDRSQYKEFVQNKLCDSNPSSKDKIQSLLYIAFRLRNNLYHGIKDISILYDQNDNFKQINLFLMEVVDKKDN
ncbi:MAG: hypothetical protein EOM38_09305 [Bacilli bacterium]|nr:hypothetical protein [Bacilli bacterium]